MAKFVILQFENGLAGLGEIGIIATRENNLFYVYWLFR